MISINLVGLILAFAVCVPSATVGFAFWALEKRLEKREKRDELKRLERQKEIDDREAKRQENEYLTLRCVTAALALGEATARAVQRIPDAHCNGDMKEALEYATKVKHEQKEFIQREGVQSIYRDREAG